MRRYRTPPWLVATGVALIYTSVDVVVPLALSTLTRHVGWGDGPSVANLAGVPVLVAGIAIILWSGARHATQWRSLDWRVLKYDRDHLLTPDYLVTDGPYAYTRNPLYVGDLLMWAGWAILLGSPAVLAGALALGVGLQAGVRLEERGLLRQFGDDWKKYARTTPRFIGWRRPAA